MRSATAPRKELIRQTPLPEAGAVVVTCRYDGDAGGPWETRVEGGRLDGWTLASDDEPAALRCHALAVKMVREAAGSEAL